MNIALLSHDSKRELMVQFCIAYKGILAKHSICATNTTGRLVMEATGLPVTLYLSCAQGGNQQIQAKIAYDELDMVIFMADPLLNDAERIKEVSDIRRECDKYTIPFASNIATAELLIMGLDRGDLAWREVLRMRG
ncbi:MAG: methylglyoxal synthase [Clostridiales bacterium]|jgi:methylglyoxal synthase|nr:methylglyoxal synthase [Clostridiales bacterium]